MRRILLVAAGALLLVLATGAIAFFLAPNGGRGGVPTDRKTVQAPIESVDVLVLESDPPQYVLRVRAGLPSGCAEQYGHEVGRDGDVITVTVLNSMPAGDPPCTMIYGTYELSISLGSDFRPGVTYTARVNDKTTTFRSPR